MYLGWSLWEWFVPLNPTYTHNYLEKTYSRAQLIDGEYKTETEEIVKNPEYQRYYVMK